MLLRLFATPPHVDLFRLGNSYLLTYEGVWRGTTRDCKYQDLFLFCTYLQSQGHAASLKDFSRQNVVGFIGWRVSAGDAPKTIARRFSTLSHFCRHLRETRKGFNCNLGGIPLPPVARILPCGLTDSEVAAIRAQARKDGTRGDFIGLRDCVMLETFLSTGLRIAEITGLRREQLSDDCVWLRRVHVKGGRERTVLVLPSARDLLKKYIEVRAAILAGECPSVNELTSALFPALRSPTPRTFQGIKNVYRAVVSIGERAGVDVHPHQLRHTVARALLDQTQDLRLVAQQLGHMNLQTTMLYTERTDDELREKLEHGRARGTNSQGGD